MLVAHKVRSRAPKLQVVWRGPYVIVGTVHERVYLVRRLGADSGRDERVHVRRLRRYADQYINVTEELITQAHFDDDEFVVGGIQGWKPDDEDGVRLKIKWVGYGPDWCTWEPIASLFQDIPHMVRNYVSNCQQESEVLRQWLRDNVQGAV